MNAPRLFALTRDGHGADEVVGYGMVLPDGSAYAVSWPAVQGASVYSTDSAEECAELRDADLLWIDETSRRRSRWFRSAARLGPLMQALLHNLSRLSSSSKGNDMKTYLEANEIPADTRWGKSRRSGSAGHCVETAAVPGGVALRHSKDPERGAFLFSPEEMSAFVQGAKDGDFDHHLSA